MIAWRDAILNDEVDGVRRMLNEEPQLVHAEFTAGRGIAQAIHHFRSAAMGCLLIDHGADLNARTTVHQVGESPVAMQLRFGTTAGVELLLTRGACPNDGLLKFMRVENMPQTIPLLLQHGWNIDEGAGAQTLLHHDTAHGHTRKVELLLHFGADPNTRNSDGQTPLHLAVTKRSRPTQVRRLLEAGASINAKDTWGKTPLEYARQVDSNRQILELLATSNDIE